MRSLLKQLSVIIIFIGFTSNTYSQEWMNGYKYRKRITIDKSKVYAINIETGSLIQKQDLPDFPLAIEIQDDDLIHVAGSRSNKMQNAEGKDISVALSTNPTVPLDFQLERYDPSTGKLTCWVKVNVLSANGTPSAPTSLYLYYGSETLHDPHSATGINTWSEDYSRVWHLAHDIAPAISMDAQINSAAQNAAGSPGMSKSNFITGKVGQGVLLNGISEFLSADADTSTALVISVWINMGSIGAADQVIIANDSINGLIRNGYQLKINSAGKLVMELYRSQTTFSATGSAQLEPNKWYYITAVVSGGQLSLYLNATLIASRNLIKLGSGGAISIGSSKQHDKYYSGIIDELRIQKTARKTEWLKTQYINQENPSLFYSVGEEEYDPSIISTFAGAISDQWDLSGNWSNDNLPQDGATVVIADGKNARISNIENVNINKLIIKQGACLLLNNNMQVNNLTQIDIGGTIKLDNDARLRFFGDIRNNGNIMLAHTTGTMILSGNNEATQHYSGTGNTIINRLETEQTAKTDTAILQAPISVLSSIDLLKGILNANGNLILLASSETNTAAISPINADQAGIMGNINVQNYISGNYSSPATARGWRLLASPVYNSIVNGSKQYDITALKKSIFVTGAGGAVNGFDDSPLNNATIYTHDQSLAGSLSQKYIGISDVSIKIPIGKGIYVFSRGSREVSNAYSTQIQGPGFSNPSYYIITYTGNVLQGNLVVQLSNKNSGNEGDGFNLLGNPYPSPILWGNLAKENLSPYIWLFDPLNNAYNVSNDPGTIIPSGSGFFVKVNNGNTAGSLTFSENSKYHNINAINKSAISSLRDIKIPIQSKNVLKEPGRLYQDRNTLIASLKRDVFEQQYMVSFDLDDKIPATDSDALKLGEGYVSIAGLADGSKLAIERRSDLKEKQEIRLYVKGYGTGVYSLTLNISDSLRNKATMNLIDHYLKKEIELQKPNTIYSFEINSNVPASQGGDRFTISIDPHTRDTKLLTENDIIVYPNPFTNKLYFKNVKDNFKEVRLTINNVLGETVLKRAYKSANNVFETECQALPKGIYIIRLYDSKTGQIIKNFKVLKK